MARRWKSGGELHTSKDELQKSSQRQVVQQVAEQWRILTSEGRWLGVAISAHKGMLFGSGLLLAIGIILYVFKEPLKADTVTQTADVAKRVIGEKKVQEEALGATKEIVSQILQDDPSLDLLVVLLKNLMQQEETKKNLVYLLENLLLDSYTKENTKKFIAEILVDPWIQDKVTSLATVGLHTLAKDKVLHDQLVDLVVKVLTDTVRDEHVQATAGDALYNAAKMGIGFSAPSQASKSLEERRLERENTNLAEELVTTRLEIAKLQAQLINKPPSPV